MPYANRTDRSRRRRRASSYQIRADAHAPAYLLPQQVLHRQAIPSKSPIFTPSIKWRHSSTVKLETRLLGLSVFPIRIHLPTRATLMHALLSQVRETRQSRSHPGIHTLTLEPSSLYSSEKIRGTNPLSLADIVFSCFSYELGGFLRAQCAAEQVIDDFAVAGYIGSTIKILIAGQAFDVNDWPQFCAFFEF